VLKLANKYNIDPFVNSLYEFKSNTLAVKSLNDLLYIYIILWYDMIVIGLNSR